MAIGDENMAEASDTQEILWQNFIDAGCEQEIVQRCIESAQQKKTAGGILSWKKS